MNFSENLSKLRKAKGIKQETLANDMKVSRQTVSKWENGTAMPDLKKLTALAEYFGVTMDELLGFTSSSDNADTNNMNDYTKEYINELISLENAESNRKINDIKGKWKTSVIILSIVLAISTFFALDSSSKLSDLKSQVNDISMAPSIITDDNNDDSNNILNDASYEILGIDKKEPWLVNVRFTYSPQTYSNSLKVMLNITDKSGNTNQLDYDNKDGKFTLDTKVDASENTKYTLIAKDDNTTSSADLAPDFTDDYFKLNFDSISSNNALKNDKFIYESNDLLPSFTVETDSKLKYGEISFFFDNEKPFVKKKCKLSTDKNNQTSFICDNFEIDLSKNYTNNEDTPLNIKYTAVDDNDIKYSAVLSGTVYISDTYFEAVKKEITFPNGKTISYDIDY